MIELIVLWCFGRAMHETAQSKGRRGWLWVVLLIVAWFSAELVGAIVGGIFWALLFGRATWFATYLISLASAAGVGIWIGKFLDGQPSLKPPTLPARAQPHAGPRAMPRAAPRAAAPVPVAATTYRLSSSGQESGPYNLAQLRELWHAGGIPSNALYWFEGAAEWQPITQLARLLVA